MCTETSLLLMGGLTKKTSKQMDTMENKDSSPFLGQAETLKRESLCSNL